MNQDKQAGKTTTALNVGYALALMNKKVMLIDSDPEAGLSQSCFSDIKSAGLSQVLQGECELEDNLTPLAQGFDVVPAGDDLADYEHTTLTGKAKGHRLRLAIKRITQEQDFILIDSPSKTGLLSVNVLLAADEIIIPTKTSTRSVQGLIRIVRLFRQLKRLSGGAKLWLTLTQVNPSDTTSSEIKNKVLQYFPQRVLNTTIRQDEALVESQKQTKAIFDYQQDGFAATDYYALAQDIVEGRTH